MGGSEAARLMIEHLLDKVEISVDELPSIIGMTAADNYGTRPEFDDVYSKPMTYEMMS